MSTLLTIAAGVLLFGIVATFVLSLTASRPDGLGVTDGRLAEAPSSPNAVSTQTAERSHWIAPLSFKSSPTTAMKNLLEVVKKFPGTSVVTQEDNYLYAEFRSSFFKFTDDVEFLIEPESNRIHFRSASRVGHSDLGANRERMEKIRTLFEARDIAEQVEDSAGPTSALEPAMSE